MIDISNPDAPKSVGSLFGQAGGDMGNIVVRSGRAYTAGVLGLGVFDVSAPTRPLLSGFNSDGSFYKDVALSGNYAFVATGSSGLKVFDVTLATYAKAPLLASYAGVGEVWGISLNNTTAYLACNTNGLQVLDVSNPSLITHVGSLLFPNSQMWDVQYYNNDVIMGPSIVDVGASSNPFLIGKYISQSYVNTSFAYNGLLYCAAADTTRTPYTPILDIANIITPASPVRIGVCQLNVASQGTSKKVFVVNNFAFVADYDRGMEIVDVSNASFPHLLSVVDTPGDAQDCATSSDLRYVYIADGLEGIQIVDIANPSLPVVVSNYGKGYNAMSIKIIGSTAYVTGYGGVRVLDISDPILPKQIGNYLMPAWAQAIAIANGNIYVAGATGGLSVLRMRDIIAPVVTITNPVFGSTYSTNLPNLVLGGSATDASNIAGISWSNDRGGGGSPTGTTSWSVQNIALAVGTNVITVTAVDGSGNTGTATLTVVYTPSDNTPPVVNITSPTATGSMSISTQTINLQGSAADNIGVTELTWANDRGGSGSAQLAQGTWSVPNLVLQEGPNKITVIAKDASGNTSSDTSTIFYAPPDTTPPTVTIDFPTVDASYATSSGSINLSGQSGDDRGVAKVEWSNNRGGTGTAADFAPWSANGIALQPGLNIIDVTATDTSGNVSTDTVSVTYTPPATPTPTPLPPLPDQKVAGTLTLDLSEIFPLELFGGQVARVATTSGTFDIELLSGDAPATAANFLSYVQAGAYTNALVHRSVPGFIIQTGGYTATLPPVAVSQKAPVVNEYKISNTRGTVAMAKLGGDPNSATNQWFVNLADNSANLDNQNGGFTVFGRVMGSGMSVVDAIAKIPVYYNQAAPFDQLPLRNMASGQTKILQPNFVAISSVSLLADYPSASSAVAALALSVVNSNTAVVSATISGKTLTLTRKAGVDGEALITLHATHLNGGMITRTFKVVDIIAPRLSISTPATTSLVPSFSLSGTVVETGSKPVIEFSTDNGAHWTGATIPPASVKSPYAWTASVTLVPGANTFLFRATDLAGNVSAITSRTVTYTVPLPVVASPAAGANLLAGIAPFKGTVPDAGGMPGVEFSADGGGSWTAAGVTGAKAPYAWSANATLSPGANTLRFRAVDVLGQRGQPVLRGVTYLKPSAAALGLVAQGSGTFTAGLAGKNLNLNMPYTVTATPAAGMIFKEWRKNGVSFSRNATLTFTMEEGLALTPVFIANPFPAVAGTFNGLVGNGKETDTNAFFLGNGFVTLTTTATGTFIGSLRLEGQTLALSGKFDGFGEANLTLLRTGKSSAQVALDFDTASAHGEIAGTVTPAGGSALDFIALPGVYTGAGTSIHPLSARSYTVALPAPDASLGHGYATMVVDAKGLATFAGKLADGTGFTTSARTVDDGAGNWVVPVHIPLYKALGGMILGEVVVPKASAFTVEGTLEWLRPADTAAGAMFPAGFLKTLEPQGNQYQPKPNISLLTGDATTGNFTLTVDPGLAALAAAIVQPGTWPKTNAPTLATPLPAGLSFTFTAATGVFKGTFNRTVGGKAVSTPYEGVIFASPLTLPDGTSPVRGSGFFSTGTVSAPVELMVP